jgi:protein subunit release factor A
MTLPMQLLFTVGRKDFVRQTFSVGGHGGGGKDTSNSGVRLIHPPSKAVGEGRENRSNTLNERSAFRKLVETKEFKSWHRAECARRLGQIQEETPEQIKDRVDRAVTKALLDGTITVEYLPGGGV